MKHFLLLLLPLLSAMQASAYDLNDFVNTCKEMPNSSYSVMEGEKLQEIFNSLSSLPGMKNIADQNIKADSLFRDVTKIETVIFLDMNSFNVLPSKTNQNAEGDESQNATADINNAFSEIRAAASHIEGYEEYVYGSLNPAMIASDSDQKEVDSLTANLTESQKEKFREIWNNSFKMAIFGKRTSELEFKDPVFIISFLGFTDMMAMNGIVPIVNIDSWVNSIQF